MGRPKKTSADFKNEIADLVQSLGIGGEQRIRNAFRKYQTLKRQKNRGQKPLSAEEIKLLKDSPLWNDYLIGRKLDKLNKHLQNAKKKEKKTNPLSAADVTSITKSTPITNRATTHQSISTTYVNPLASTHVANSADSAVHILSFPNSNSRDASTAATSPSISSPSCSTSTQIYTAATTNTTSARTYSPSNLPQCSPSTQRVRLNINEDDSVGDLLEGK